MKIEIRVGYRDVITINPDNFSDKTFGRFIKELLSNADELEKDSMKEVNFKIAEGDLE